MSHAVGRAGGMASPIPVEDLDPIVDPPDPPSSQPTTSAKDRFAANPLMPMLVSPGLVHQAYGGELNTAKKQSEGLTTSTVAGHGSQLAALGATAAATRAGLLEKAPLPESATARAATNAAADAAQTAASTTGDAAHGMARFVAHHPHVAHTAQHVYRWTRSMVNWNTNLRALMQRRGKPKGLIGRTASRVGTAVGETTGVSTLGRAVQAGFAGEDVARDGAERLLATLGRGAAQGVEREVLQEAGLLAHTGYLGGIFGKALKAGATKHSWNFVSDLGNVGKAARGAMPKVEREAAQKLLPRLAAWGGGVGGGFIRMLPVIGTGIGIGVAAWDLKKARDISKDPTSSPTKRVLGWSAAALSAASACPGAGMMVAIPSAVLSGIRDQVD